MSRCNCLVCGAPIPRANEKYCRFSCYVAAVESRSLADRLLPRIVRGDASECWLWTGAKNKLGYGRLRVRKQFTAAHRAAYELAHGPIPAGSIVMHKCDNPPCCNPNHLVVGSYQDNVDDMIRKGRQGFHKVNRFGERNPRAKLSTAQVIEIRSAYAAGGISQSQLAKRYGVTQPAIGYITRGESRTHG